EESDRPIDGRDRNTGIDLGRAPINLLDVGVVFGIRQHARDDAALLGHFQPPVDTQALEARDHVPPVRRRRSTHHTGTGRAFLPVGLYWPFRARVPSPISLASRLRCLA